MQFIAIQSDTLNCNNNLFCYSSVILPKSPFRERILSAYACMLASLQNRYHLSESLPPCCCYWLSEIRKQELPMAISGASFTPIFVKICQIIQSMKCEGWQYTHARRHTHTAWCSHKVTFFPPFLRQCDKTQDYWPCRKRNGLRQEVLRDCMSEVRLLTLFCVTRQLIHLSDHHFFTYKCNYLWRLVTYLQRNVYLLFCGLVFTRIHTKIRNCCCLSMQSPTNRECFLIHTIFDTLRVYRFTYILEGHKSISQRHSLLFCSRQTKHSVL
jgi:hypothetical protein